MTWIIGASTMFGNGILMSDIRVTRPDTDEYWDVLQKARFLGPFIVGGFAGDVRTGLLLLDNLEGFIHEMNPGANECCLPQWVAAEWSMRARDRFSSLPNAGNASILIVGVEPASDQLGNTKASVIVFRSPNFDPEITAGGNQVQSIGSGSQVQRYIESLKYLGETKDIGHLRFEIGVPGGFGLFVANLLHRDVQMHPDVFVSPHFQLFQILADRVIPSNSQDMPELARTWDELVAKIGIAMASDALIA